MLFRELAPPRILRAVINVHSIRVGVSRTYVYIHTYIRVSVEVHVRDGERRTAVYPLPVRVLVLRGYGEDHALRAAIRSCTRREIACK